METKFFPEMWEAMKHMNSPAVQEAMKLANSPAAREAVRFINSPDSQAALRYFCSPETQVALRRFYSPETQRDLQIMHTLERQEAMRRISSPAVKTALNTMERTCNAPESEETPMSSKAQRLDEIYCATDTSDLLLQKFSNAVSTAVPYVKDASEEHTEPVLPAAEPKPKVSLSLSDILTLINILITIYTAILASLPDKQSEQVIAQNDIIIEQQSEMIETGKELEHTLNHLSDCINLFAEEFNALYDTSEISDETVGYDSESNNANAQQQDSNIQK